MKTLAVLSVMLSSIIIREDVPDAQYRALASEPQFASAVRILRDSAGSGSGVLIASRWVITAAHVVAGAGPNAVKIELGGERLRVRRIVVHSQFLTRNGFARTPFDQALLELESPTNIAPAHIANSLPEVGALVTMVGYGVGGVGASDSAGTRRAARNRIDQVGGKLRSIELGPNMLLLDFDTPNRATSNTLGSPNPEPLEGIASGGDSGGGLFVQRESRWELVGTFSVSSVSLAAAASRDFAGSINLFVGVAANRAWIDSVMAGNR